MSAPAIIHVKLVVATLFWALTPIFGRMLACYSAPYVLAFGRFMVATLVLWYLLARSGERVHLHRAHLGGFMLLGLTGVCLHNVLVFMGVEHTEANRATRKQCDRETRRIAAALQAAETEIDAELAQLGAQRREKVGDLPAAIVAEYDRLRGKDKLAGRAAALLVDGECGGCRVKLPVLEYNRMRAKPEDTLLTCPRCARVLVR